ncbi:copper amine oxidase N-terminal domain-containing protein [Saccharibacillus sp. CPCC 101409]|uniref:copper amine oxidase N-terminal domain-containing protein n=1 Tax=Saccharibacillus sp. CPCC 101409 TaxID=3058041 RepID=UPI002671B02F|nr:copper amine oxidase N-terminal domain-containing protein [Saccharibacillus sp. CPCC 101409]MDO3409302.1 copper amine oxidase N-terminal domain-containing protein [Saccharibacillus sp. CPCC 101409]
MKNRLYKWAAGLLAGSLLITPIPHAEASEPPSLVLNGSPQSEGSAGLEVRDGRTYIPAETAARLLGFRANYDSASQTLTLLRPDARIDVKPGEERAEINGRIVKTGAAAFIRGGRAYIPLKLLSSAPKIRIGREAGANTVTLSDAGRFRMIAEGDRTAWVSFESGEVYSLESGSPRKLADADVSDLDWGTLDIRPLGGSAYLLTVGREYGASMQIVNHRFQFLVKNGTVRRQMHERYSGMYSTAQFGPQTLPAQRAYMTDGQTVQVVGANGALAATYELEELTGQTGPFIVESVTADYLLVRAFDTLQPTLIDLNAHRSVLLYRELLDAAEQKEWDEVSTDTGEPLLLQSRLRFVKQEGGELTFTYRRIAPGGTFGGTGTVVYTLKR